MMKTRITSTFILIILGHQFWLGVDAIILSGLGMQMGITKTERVNVFSLSYEKHLMANRHDFSKIQSPSVKKGQLLRHVNKFEDPESGSTIACPI